MSTRMHRSTGNQGIRLVILTKICFAISLAIIGLSLGQVQAATSYWNTDADGNWNDSLNWSGGVPNAQAAVADFSTIDITADRTVTLDITPTVGSLIFGDTDTDTPASWIIAGDSYRLTLDNTGGTGDPTVTVNTGASATISAPIYGYYGLTKAGEGTLTLSGANTYTGTTTLSAGTLNLNNISALGSSITFTINGGRIDNTSGAAVALSASSAQNWNGDFAFTGTNNLDLGTGAVTMNGNRMVTVDAGTLTVGGAISGTGYSLTKLGAGTLSLSTAATYTGNTYVYGGMLYGPSNPLTASTTVSFNNGGTLSVDQNFNATGYVIDVPTGQSGTLESRRGGSIQPTTITGSGDLTVQTSGNRTVSLQGAAWASFTGDINLVNTTTTLSWVRARVNGGSFSGFNAATAVHIGANINFYTPCYTGGNSVTMGSLSGDVGSVLSGASSGTGGVTYIIGDLGTDTVFSGNIDNNSYGLSLTKTGTGKLTIAGSNNSTGITTINAGTLQIGNGGTTGALGSGAVTNNASLVFNRSDTLVIANAISGSGTTTINGGTIYLNGTVANLVNVSSGATLGGQGTVSLAATIASGGKIEGGQAGTGVLTVGSLTFSGLGTANFMPANPATAPLNVTNSITTNGASTVTINILGSPLNVATYTLIDYGTTITNFADFTLGTTPGGGGSRPKSYALSNNTTNTSIDLDVTGSDSNITWTGLASSSWDTTPRLPGTTNWKYTNPASGTSTDFYVSDNVLFDDSGAKTVDISVADVTPSGVAFTNTAGNDYTLSGTSGIAGMTALQKSGDGKVTISSVNSYTGGTTINGGTISIASDGTSGTSAPLGLVPTSATPNNVVLNGGALSASAPFTLDANRGVALGPTSGAGSGTIDVEDYQVFTVDGIVANNGTDVIGYGTGSLNKTGSGTLTLNAANTFSGETVIWGGELQLGNLYALQNSTLNYDNQGGTLSTGALVGAHTKSGSGYVTSTPVTLAGLNGSQDLLFTGAVLGIGNLDVSSNYSGAMNGSGSLVKFGTGDLTLTGVNTYYGDTFIDRGNIIVTGSGGLNTYGPLYLASGGNEGGGSGHVAYGVGSIIFMDSATGIFTAVDIGWGTRSGANFTIQDSADVAVYGDFDLNNETAGSGTSTNNVVALNGGTLSVGGFLKTSTDSNHLATMNFNGTLIIPSGGGTGTSFLPALTGLTAYVQAGGVIIDDQGGSVQIDQPLLHDSALGTTPDGGLHKIGNGLMILAGDNTYTGPTLIDDGTLQLGNGTDASGLLGTGAITNNGTLVLSRTGTFTIASAISGSGSLVQQGYGSTAILASANSYTGSTTVTAGTLSLSGSQATSGVTVNYSAALAVGTGGASVQALTFGSSSFDTQTFIPSDGSALTTMTVANLNGLVANGTTTIDPGYFGYSIGTTYVLLDYNGSIGGNGYSGFTLSLPSRVVGNLVNNTGNTSIDLYISAVKYPKWNGNINNGTTGDWDINLTQNWKEYSTGNATVYLESPAPDLVYFDDSATGVTNVNITTTVSPTLVTVTNSTKNYTFSGTGTISGSTPILKSGSGTLTIINTGGNNYTGGTTISGGAVSFGTGALPTTGSVVMDGGTLQWYAGNTDDVSDRLSFVSGKTATLDTNGNDVTAASAWDFDSTVSLVKAGSGTMTLTNVNSTFAGDFYINGGTVAVDAANNNTWPANSALGNPQVDHNIVVNNGGTLRFDADRTLGSAGTNVNTVLVINEGGTVTNSNGVFTTLGPVYLNGGTLTSTGGGTDEYHQSYFIREGAVTVGGTSPSTISSSGTNSGFHLSDPTVFDVADVTGDANTDLLVSTVLLNGTASNSPYPVGALTKTGAGTMVVTETAAYNGNTIVNGGVLDMMDVVANATVNSTVEVTSGELIAQSITANNLIVGAGAKVVIKPLTGASLAGLSTLSPVPEPSTLVLLTMAVLATLVAVWRRK